ncbi:MAG: M1 family metallopeptidase, partial [Planctomycetota bacterium]
MSNVFCPVSGGAARMSAVVCAAFWVVVSAGHADQPTNREGPQQPVAGGESRPGDAAPRTTGCSKSKALGTRFMAAQTMSSPGRKVGSTPPEGSADRTEPHGDTDVLHYDLDIEVSELNPGGSECNLSGRNRMTIQSKSTALAEFTFRLRSQYTITSALVDDTTPVTVTTASLTTRVVTLDRTYGMDEIFTLTIEYNGITESDGPWNPISVTTQPGAGAMVFTISVPYFSYTWWPVKDGDAYEPGDNSDKATVEFSITAPDNLVVPSNGGLLSIEVMEGNTKRYNWASDYPIAPYLVCFAGAEYNTWTVYYDYATGSMPVEFYIYPAWDTTQNRQGWEKVVGMIEVFADIFGEYPFINDKYGIYNAPFAGGMEHQTIVAQGGGDYAFDEYLTAHELSHMWWGDSITCETWNHVWLNEGFGSYAEALWAELKPGGGGLPALKNYMATMKYTGAGSVYVTDDEVGNIVGIFDPNTSYSKGAWVLHMLRYVLGDDDFFAALAAYRAAYEFGAATTEDFQAICESFYAGGDLGWFFQEWVYGQRAPAYNWGWKSGEVAGQDYLYVRITQTHESSDPEVFTMPVNLFVTAGGSIETITVWNDARTQYFAVPVSGPVTNVVFDPFEWILRTEAISAPYTPVTPVVAASPHDARKNRYLSFVVDNEVSSAVQVEMTASAEFPGSTGLLGWVGEPDANDVSRVVALPYYSDTWPAVVHLADCAIVPVATYELRTTWDAATFSDSLEIGTILKPLSWHYGDVVGVGTGDLPPLVGFTPPNGAVNVSDIQAFLLTVKGSSSPSVPITWVDLHGLGVGSPPNFILNVSDLQRILWGIDGQLWIDAP